MLTLLLLRHAKSSWDNPGLGDFDRPLAKRGKKAAPAIGKALAAMGQHPDLVLCSSAVRARATLDLVLPELGKPAPRIVYDEAIYMATPGTLLARLHAVGTEFADQPPRSVMLVGHNPGLEELAMMLSRGGVDDDTDLMAEKFPTAAVAIFTFDTGSWKSIAPGAGRLEQFLTPRQLA